MSMGKAIAALSGQESVLVIRLPLAEWLDRNVIAALMLDQSLFWSDSPKVRERGGWFYRTDTEWADAFMTTVYQIKQAREMLKKRGLMDVELRGAPPKLWYRADPETIADAFLAWLGKAETFNSLNSPRQFVESDESTPRIQRVNATNPPSSLYIQKEKQKKEQTGVSVRAEDESGKDVPATDNPHAPLFAALGIAPGREPRDWLATADRSMALVEAAGGDPIEHARQLAAELGRVPTPMEYTSRKPAALLEEVSK